MLLPTWVTMPNSVILGQNSTSVIMEICQKILTAHAPAFQCHSRSLEPTRIDRLPMTSY